MMVTSGNEWMSETVTSIAYKEEITATVCPCKNIVLKFLQLFYNTSIIYYIFLFSLLLIVTQRNVEWIV